MSILDGNTLRIVLDDEDDFAMLAENLFTELDTDDRGKIRKSEIHNALVHMGIEMGIPPFSGSYPPPLSQPILCLGILTKSDICAMCSCSCVGLLSVCITAIVLQPVIVL